MNNVLNSSFVNSLLKFGLSKGGMVVTFVATWMAAHIIGWLGLKLAVAPDDLARMQTGIETGLTTFGMAMLAAFYAWLNDRQKRGVEVLQTMHNMESPKLPVQVDGIAGNKTVGAVAYANDISPTRAIQSVDAQ
jgi:hypothetical protein